jgi:hypothetical protein
MTKKNLPDTFKVDNLFIQGVPALFGQKRAVQLALPGLAPFGTFDLWATLALYSLLDPAKPEEEATTTYTELLEVLQFTRLVSEELGGAETFRTDEYRLVEDTLHRLFTVEVSRQGLYRVKVTDKKTGKPTKGRPRHHYVEFRGRILITLRYIYPPDVEPPDLLPPARRKNVNRANTLNGELSPPIWKRVDGPKPKAIGFQFHPQLVKGIQGEMIGATTLPLRIFGLRKTLGRNVTATRLLVWTLRQTAQTMTRRLSGLAEELNLEAKQPSRSRAALVAAFGLLKDAGVVADFSTEERDDGDTWVTFTKAPDWHFARVPKTKTPPSLPAPEGEKGAV